MYITCLFKSRVRKGSFFYLCGLHGPQPPNPKFYNLIPCHGQTKLLQTSLEPSCDTLIIFYIGKILLSDFRILIISLAIPFL